MPCCADGGRSALLAPRPQTDVSIHWGTAGLSPQQQEALKEAQFFWDENHPWDRTGHR